MAEKMSSDPVCARCKSTSSLMWQRDSEGAVVCLDCHTAEKVAKSRSSPSTESVSSQNGKPSRSSGKSTQRHSPSPLSIPVQSGVTTRRTTRSHERAKARQQQQQQQQQQQTLTTPPQQAVTTRVPSPAPAPVSTAQQPSVETTISTTIPDKPEKPDTPPPPQPTAAIAPAERGRRSLRQGPVVRAPENSPYLLSSNSVQHQVSFQIHSVRNQILIFIPC